MNEIILLLDTNILWNRRICRRLADKKKAGQLRVYIPTLVHAERVRQMADQFGDRFALSVIRQYIADTDFELLPLSIADAETLAEIWLELKQSGVDSKYWHQHRFDIMLCAVARATGYTLVVEDRGEHFKTIPARLSLNELEKLIDSLPD